MKKEDKKFIKLIFTSILFLLIAITTTYLASYYIEKTFIEVPIVRDLLWEKLPYFDWMWLSEGFLILSVFLGVLEGFKQNKNLIPYALILISIFHLLRAGLVILTPLGFPGQYGGFIHIKTLYGAFPSGHLSVPYLIFMVSKKKRFFLLAFLVGLTLLICRGHYSIDLIGTLLLAYPIFKFSEKYIRKYFEK